MATPHKDPRRLGIRAKSWEAATRAALGLRSGLALADTELARQYKTLSSREEARTPQDELPMSVKNAARYLGVSVQTVYLWVERKQIPHLRVMGRNIRFLKSDLERFRAQFRYEVVESVKA